MKRKRFRIIVAFCLSIFLPFVIAISNADQQEVSSHSQSDDPQTQSVYTELGDDGDDENEGLQLELSLNRPFSDIVELAITSTADAEVSVCTSWKLSSEKGEKSLCNGNEACCSFLELEQLSEKWDESLYLNKGKHNIGLQNRVTAQVVSADYLIDQHNPFLDIEYSEPQSIEFSFEESPADDQNLPVGDLLIEEHPLTNTSSIYIELDPIDIEFEKDITLEFSGLKQGVASLDKPVQWHQQLTLHNLGSEQKKVQVNLLSYNLPDNFPSGFLQSVESYSISSSGEPISQSPTIVHKIEGSQNITFDITYETPSIQVKKNCIKKSLESLFSEDVRIIHSEIPLSKVIQQVCTLTIFHQATLPYENISLSLGDISASEIHTAYYLEGKEFIEVQNNTLVFPSLYGE